MFYLLGSAFKYNFNCLSIQISFQYASLHHFLRALEGMPNNTFSLHTNN